MYDFWMPFDLAAKGYVCCSFCKHGTTTNVGFNENLDMFIHVIQLCFCLLM
jgi:hypothetical protein